MIIKLPRPCTGLEIVGALKQASLLQEKPDSRCSADEFVGEYELVPDSYQPIPLSKGIRVEPERRLKRFGFFGRRVWKKEKSSPFRTARDYFVFTFNPVRLAQHYEEIDVSIFIRILNETNELCDRAALHYCPDTKRAIQEILASFRSLLQPQTA